MAIITYTDAQKSAIIEKVNSLLIPTYHVKPDEFGDITGYGFVTALCCVGETRILLNQDVTLCGSPVYVVVTLDDVTINLTNFVIQFRELQVVESHTVSARSYCPTAPVSGLVEYTAKCYGVNMYHKSTIFSDFLREWKAAGKPRYLRDGLHTDLMG